VHNAEARAASNERSLRLYARYKRQLPNQGFPEMKPQFDKMTDEEVIEAVHRYEEQQMPVRVEWHYDRYERSQFHYRPIGQIDLGSIDD
jgi:hypothetical protein